MDEDKGNSAAGLGASHSVDSVEDESNSWKCISLRIKVTKCYQNRKSLLHFPQSVTFGFFRRKGSENRVEL